MLASLKPGVDFSKGCAHPATRPRISTTHPHRLIIRELTLATPVAARENKVNLCLACSLFETFTVDLHTPHRRHLRRGNADRSGLARILSVPLHGFGSLRSRGCYLPHSQDWPIQTPLEIQPRSLSIPLPFRCPGRSVGTALRQRAPTDLCSLPSLLSALQGSDPRTSHWVGRWLPERIPPPTV